jgi:hypothetical protein
MFVRQFQRQNRRFEQVSGEEPEYPEAQKWWRLPKSQASRKLCRQRR